LNADFCALVNLAKRFTVLENYEKAQSNLKTRIHFIDDFQNYAEVVFTHYRNFKQQQYLVVHQCLTMLGLDYTETTEVLDAFWKNLPQEQTEPRIVDLIPHIASIERKFEKEET